MTGAALSSADGRRGGGGVLAQHGARGLSGGGAPVREGSASACGSSRRLFRPGLGAIRCASPPELPRDPHGVQNLKYRAHYGKPRVATAPASLPAPRVRQMVQNSIPYAYDCCRGNLQRTRVAATKTSTR